MIGDAGWTNGADRVDVVNRGGRDYGRVLGAIGVWVDGQEGTSSFILENHWGSPDATAAAALDSCGVRSIVTKRRGLSFYSFSYI